MSRRASYYNQALHVLQWLHKLYPNYNMGRHLATALDGYGDVWGMTDKEIAFALDKYMTQLSLDSPHGKDDVERIINDAMDLNGLYKEEENGYND